MYVSLWTRLEGFERGALTHALESATAVQGTLMRATIHLVSAADYWPFAIAIRRVRRQWWLRAQPGAPSAREMTGAARTLRRRLVDGPLHRRAIEDLLGKPRAAGVGLWLDLLRAPPSGTWERRRADLYALAEVRLPPPSITPAKALEQLVAGYLRGFGPASRHDIANWAGMGVGDLAPAIARLDLCRYRAPEGDELLDVAGAPLPDPATPAPVRFLPVWDAALLVHARRTGILPEAYRPRVFHVRKPHGTPTFLVDGAVAGSWRYEDGRVTLDPFAPLDRTTRQAAADEADRLAAFHR